MKTSLVTALIAAAAAAITVAVAGCSSDNSSSLVSDAGGTVTQGGACSDSTDCEAPLSCGFAIYNDAGSCKSTGVCVALGPVSTVQACSCGSTPTAITVEIGVDYATQPINQGVTCAGATTGEGGTTTPTTDSGSGTTTKTDSGSGTTTTDSGSGTVKDAATGG